MSKAWSRFKGRMIAASYALGWWLVCRVPESWGRWLFQKAGGIAWRRQGGGVQVLEANLRRVVGPEATGAELRALSRRSMSSYAKARAEGLGIPCDVGFAERTERMLLALVPAGLTGLGVPYVLPIGLWVLAVLSVVTFGQRVAAVRRGAGRQAPPAAVQNHHGDVEPPGQPRTGAPA